MRTPVIINGFEWYLSLENEDITLWESKDSTLGYSIYSSHITADERRQIKKSKTYRELYYGVSLD